MGHGLPTLQLCVSCRVVAETLLLTINTHTADYIHTLTHCMMIKTDITQYSSTAYLGMIPVVSGQFPRIENIWRSTMAKRGHEKSKEHHRLTKRVNYKAMQALK